MAGHFFKNWSYRVVLRGGTRIFRVLGRRFLVIFSGLGDHFLGSWEVVWGRHFWPFSGVLGDHFLALFLVLGDHFLGVWLGSWIPGLGC